MSERRWRLVMWSSSFAAAPLHVLWIVTSTRWAIGWESKVRFPGEPNPVRWDISTGWGLIQFTNRLASDREGFTADKVIFAWKNLVRVPDRDHPVADLTKSPMGSTTWALSINVPAWIPALLCLSAGCLGAARFRAKRRDRLRGMCVHCGYDRTGLDPAAGCPECGSIPGPAQK